MQESNDEERASRSPRSFDRKERLLAIAVRGWDATPLRKTSTNTLHAFRSPLEALEQIRAAIRSVGAAGATEAISYGMPAFKHNGVLVWFAAFSSTAVCSRGSSVIEAFQGELKSYASSKGTDPISPRTSHCQLRSSKSWSGPESRRMNAVKIALIALTKNQKNSVSAVINLIDAGGRKSGFAKAIDL